MKTAVLDGEKIPDRETLHETLARGLDLPASYGRNLDALYDCLTERRDATEIRIVHPDALRQALGRYADTLLSVLRDAGGEGGAVRLTFAEDPSLPDDGTPDGIPDPADSADPVDPCDRADRADPADPADPYRKER